MIEVKRKDGESFESLMKRFGRKVQQSGILIRARRIRYHARTKSENLKRRSALRRLELKQQRDEAKRLGLPYKR
jgi:ribosomal protein S21